MSILFAAFLGYNPIEHLLGPHALAALSRARPRARSPATRFFPQLISAPFRTGLHAAFAFAIVACLVAAAASLMRGGRYEPDAPPQQPRSTRPVPMAVGATRDRRSSMQVEWYGQSAFRLAAGRTTVFIDPFGDVSGLAAPRRCSSTTRRSTAWTPTSLLVTHEHLDHNGVEAIGGEPGDLCARPPARLESPLGEVTAIASEHDAAAGTERGPNTIFVFSLDGVRVAHFGDFGQSALRDEQAAGDRPRSTCCSCRSAAGPTIGAAAGRDDRRAASPALGRADALPHAADRLPRARRRVPRPDAGGGAAGDPVFDTDGLPAQDSPLVVVPAVP